MTTAGLLLAAGAGRRMGGPKALVRDANGTPWVCRALAALAGGGCAPLYVVVGAEAELVRKALGECDIRDAEIVACHDWEEGMGASLRAGLAALLDGDGDGDGDIWRGGDVPAALVHLVDLPDVDERVVARVRAVGEGRAALARAAYLGVPGHPVLLGADHWEGVIASAVGDRGARDYLRERRVELVECGDLATGADVDVTATS
ncbi:MAG: NTP transferase domain-containing protein [Micrococcales bacterium]|nr:NTP transferase domain-containing protein [Micrococcales bacterium]